MCRGEKTGSQPFDALAGKSESVGLDLYEEKVKNTEISQSRGIGVRLFVDNKPGYAFTEKLYSYRSI